MISPRSRNSIRAVFLLLLCASLLVPAPAAAASFVVNSADDSDDGQCDSNHCSLREAIDAANNSPGPDTISFAGLDATGGSISIHLLSFLPPLLDHETTIDGTTVQGYSNKPLINIVKAAGVIEDGIAIQSNNNVIRGLSLPGFGLWPGGPDPNPEDTYGGAIVVTGSGNLIEGNVLGWGAWQNTVGVRLAGGGNSVVGNVISSNLVGVYLQGPAQIIRGNKIGTDASGNTAVPNKHGIYDTPGSGGGHIIGGAAPGEGNLISGNTWDGVTLRSSNNRVQGNRIGTNAAGTAALPNHSGVGLRGAPNNLIGDSAPGAGNLISGNSYGIRITSGSSQGSLILGNKIGSDASGTTAIPNHVGISTMGGADVTIGGLNPGEGNLIFGNGSGFRLENEDNENNYTVIGNTITQNDHSGILRIGPNPGAHGFTFSRNSIFDNGELGIKIYAWEYVVPSIAPPQLTAASGTSLSGTACPYCIVEVFVADPDPSGAGEGATYLTTVTADPQGFFTANFAPVGICQHLTATSTNSQDNTSEFAQNIQGNCIRIEPPFLYPIWVFIITVFGALGILIRRRRPDGSRFILPGSLALGVLVGAGLIVLGGALPNVIVHFTPEEPVLYHGQLPDCVSYLDPSGYSPQDGAVLEPTGDVLLAWTPAGDLPDGPIRWTVDLEQVGIDADSQITEGTSLPVSTFGMTPTDGSSFEWTLFGQRQLADGETWLPFCSPGDSMTFSITRAPTEEPTPEEPEGEEPTPTVTPTVEPTEPACTPTLTALMNLTCRSGPLNGYEELGFLLEGETAVPEGQNEDASWFWIPNPDWQGHCWVWSGGVEAVCMPDRLPLIAYDPLPEPSPACVSTLDRSACNDAGGVWSVDTNSCQCP